MQTSQHVECDRMPWAATETLGVECKSFAMDSGARGFEASLFRLAAGASLPVPPAARIVEVFVLDGSWTLPSGTLLPGGYSRQAAAQAGSNSTETGCTLFVRAITSKDAVTELVHAQTDEAPWLPGQGNLRVKPLFSAGTEGTALVHWPKDERFIPHRHFGGEEIFVLSGTFLDEHGRYPKHTWILSEHLSAHHPFVEEETVILVKTGHLPIASET